MGRVDNIPRRDMELRTGSWRENPRAESIGADLIGSLKIGEATLCLRVAIEELVHRSWRGGTRRYRVADIGEVVPLNGCVLTSDIDRGVSGRPREGEEVSGIGVEVRVDDVKRGERVSRPDLVSWYG